MHAGSGHTRARRPDPRIALAWGLTAVSFFGSWSHCYERVLVAGQPPTLAAVIATLPEVSVLLALLSLQAGDRGGWVIVTGASAFGFTAWANWATASAGWWSHVVAVWPAWSAITALMLTHRSLQPVVHAYSDTPVHTPDTPAVHASDTVPDTPVHTIEHTSDTPSSTLVHTPKHTPKHTPDTGAVHASDTPSGTAVHTDADTLRTQDVHTVRGAMRALGCGQARAKAALERAWT